MAGAVQLELVRCNMALLLLSGWTRCRTRGSPQKLVAEQTERGRNLLLPTSPAEGAKHHRLVVYCAQHVHLMPPPPTHAVARCREATTWPWASSSRMPPWPNAPTVASCPLARSGAAEAEACSDRGDVTCPASPSGKPKATVSVLDELGETQSSIPDCASKPLYARPLSIMAAFPPKDQEQGKLE
jgi:hypothetical protein